MENETPTIQERQEQDKQAVIQHLKEMPIIQVACKRAGVSRATFYRWRSEDKDFYKDSELAVSQGFEFINDMSESQIVTLIKEKKMPAITLWLKHHHPRYGAKLQLPGETATSAYLNRDAPEYRKFKQVADRYEEELKQTIISQIHDRGKQKSESDSAAV